MSWGVTTEWEKEESHVSSDCGGLEGGGGEGGQDAATDKNVLIG